VHEQNWLKYGILAIAVVGTLAIVVFAMTRGEGLEDRTWIAHEMSVDGTMTPPVPENPPYAAFDNGAISGSSGCNSYTGGYEASGGSMAIGPLAATKMACITPLMGQETVYFGLLGQVDSYEVNGDELVLSGNGVELIWYVEGTVETPSG